MKNKTLPGLFAVAASIFLAAAGYADSLPEGSFRGSTALTKSPDVMALLLKKDPKNPDVSYAILADYDRINGWVGPERLAITRWVRRMYAYRVEKVTELQYALKPLVSAQGEIQVDGKGGQDMLSLKKAGTLDGAKLTRYDKNSVVVAETIKFKGHLGSTWENYVPGTFFGTKDSSGGDYFGKDVNMVLSKDGVADFSQEEIKGKYSITEKAPGMFAFTAIGSGHKGSDKVLTRIGVFVDIVNWKPLFTTDELLLINPDDAKDVGFYYERH